MMVSTNVYFLKRRKQRSAVIKAGLESPAAMGGGCARSLAGKPRLTIHEIGAG